MRSPWRDCKNLMLFIDQRCPCSPLAVFSGHWTFSVAMAAAAAYQSITTRNLQPLSTIIWRWKPVLYLGLVIHAVVHSTLGRQHPQQASSVTCFTLVCVVAHRLASAIAIPEQAIYDELVHFQLASVKISSTLLCGCVGASLGGHSKVPCLIRYSTLLLFNGGFLARGVILYHRTGHRPSSRRVLAGHAALYLLTILCLFFAWAPAVSPASAHTSLRRARPEARTHTRSRR